MFITGKTYSKIDLYNILAVPTNKQGGSWNTGYVRYDNEFFIFANIGVPGRTGHDYDNHWKKNGDLVWYAKTRTTVHQAAIKVLVNPNTNVHIFTRTQDRAPFTYQGLGFVKKLFPQTPVKIIWQFERRDLVDVDKAWAALQANATEFAKTKESFRSPFRGEEYKIASVTRNKITIESVTEGSKTLDLSFSIFQAAIDRFNTNHGVLPRKGLNNNVALETTIISLSPMLDWDDSFDNIVYIDPLTDAPATTFNEAQNDDRFETISLRKRIRQGQNKLRNNLFAVYNSTCCITGCTIKELLHACHILPHAQTGNNTSTNALLMRSDIHDLFDGNLLGIDPRTLRIKVKSRLLNTEYAILDGKQLLHRTDDAKPNQQSLTHRWQLFNRR